MISSFLCVFFFFFKQKTAYEMRISDWSSDVCSSDLRVVLGDLSGVPFDLLFRGRVETGDDFIAGRVSQLTGGGNPDVRPRPEVERLLPFEVPIVHSPEFGPVRPYQEVQRIRIGHFIGLFHGLGVRDLDVGKRHDGFTCKRLTGTIKNTIKADGMLMVPAGSAWIPFSDSHRKNGGKPAACWTFPDVAGKVTGAQKRTRTSTTLRSPAPEAGASTNSAIWARGRSGDRKSTRLNYRHKCA